MSRLIDADALLEKMSTHCDLCQYNDHIHPCRRECDWHEAIDEVEDMDEVEIEPVRHGHWIPADIYHEDVYICSVCHADIAVPISFDYRPTYKYCPMCGAKLDEATT